MTMLSSYLAFTFAILLCLFLGKSHGAPKDNPLVNTNVGVIRGLNAEDGDYSMFMGIPFGKLDERNPFGPSEPYPDFKEIFDANNDSAICPQVEEFNGTFVGSLDCLQLNVYVPSSASPENPLPVLVWIYGGGFSIGFAGRYVYGPKYLVRHDVILVTLNYRLGPYGFMCLGTPEYPGNQGLKDQTLGLRWVKDNIGFFGGNADQITIFGESAGSYSVEYHIRTDKDKLFNKGIMESGTMMYQGFNMIPDQSLALKLAAVLGLETDDLSKALAFLATIDPKQVIAGASEVAVTYGKNPFTVCVGKDSIGPEILVDKNMKILVGYNNDEIGMRRNNVSNPTEEITNALKTDFDFNDEKLSKMVDIVKHFYVDDRELDIVDFLADYQFGHPTQREVENFIQNGVEEVYQYVFSYVGGRNFVKRRNNITAGGAFHQDEIGYLFDVSFWPEDPAPEDKLILDRMTTLWANFAKYGNPTPETSQLLPVKWEPITPNSPLYYLDIDSELSLQTRPFNQRLTFWDLFYETNKQFYKSAF